MYQKFRWKIANIALKNTFSHIVGKLVLKSSNLLKRFMPVFYIFEIKFHINNMFVFMNVSLLTRINTGERFLNYKLDLFFGLKEDINFDESNFSYSRIAICNLPNKTNCSKQNGSKNA